MYFVWFRVVRGVETPRVWETLGVWDRFPTISPSPPFNHSTAPTHGLTSAFSRLALRTSWKALSGALPFQSLVYLDQVLQDIRPGENKRLILEVLSRPVLKSCSGFTLLEGLVHKE